MQVRAACTGFKYECAGGEQTGVRAVAHLLEPYVGARRALKVGHVALLGVRVLVAVLHLLTHLLLAAAWCKVGSRAEGKPGLKYTMCTGRLGNAAPATLHNWCCASGEGAA